MSGGTDDMRLTKDQNRAIRQIKSGRNVFISGGTGSGKSAVIEAAVRILEEQGRTVAVCAPTGMAALNIGGMTVHTLFGFPAQPCVRRLDASKGSFLYEKASALVKAADCLVIDESSLLRVDFFDSLILSVRRAEKESGKRIQLVLIGDFYQIPPVLTKKDRPLLESFYGAGLNRGYAFKGLYWDKCDFHSIILHEIVRQKDTSFIDCLNLIRAGDPSGLDYLNKNVAIGKPKNDAVSLFARDQDVSRVNKAQMDALAGRSHFYETTFSYEEGHGSEDIDTQVLAAIPKSLELKDGARVMFTANDYPGNRAVHQRPRKWEGPLFVNGLTGIVLKADTNGTVTVYTDLGKIGEIGPVSHPVYSSVVQEGRLAKIKVATWHQIPLCLAYAMTFHRCQGQTLEAVHMDPSSFEPGQFYVGASRCTSLEGLSLSRPATPEDLITDPDVEAFYHSLENEGARHKRKHARKDSLIWIPEPLKEHVQREIALNRPVDLTISPAPECGRVHMRVPSHLCEHILQETDKWKKEAGIKRGRRRKDPV